MRLVFLDSKPLGMVANPGKNPEMQLAADLRAQARRRGTSTAPPDALDRDVILAAMATLAAGPTDVVTIAMDNVGHLARFVDARPWELIVP